MKKRTADGKVEVLIVTGTRAEYGLLKSVAEELMRRPRFRVKLLVTGTHTLKKFGYTLSEIRQDKMPVTAVVAVKPEDDMLSALNREIAGIRAYCLAHPPHLMVVLGDRDEPLAAAIVAAHLKIPVAHINGGDVSGRGVDEAIRHAITKFSHLHFASSARNAKRLLALGEEKWRVNNVGSTGLEDQRAIKYLSREELSAKSGLREDRDWLVVLHHPTPLDQAPLEKQIKPLLKVIAGRQSEDVLIIYPNSDTGNALFIRELEKLRKLPNVRVARSVPREDYLSYLKQARLLIGNSSSGIIETTQFRLPTVNVGGRQKGREAGTNVIHCGYGEKEIRAAIEKALSAKFKKICARAKSPYGKSGVDKKIADILERYAARLLSRDGKLFFKQPPGGS